MSFNRLVFCFLISLYLTCTAQPGTMHGIAYIGCYTVFAVCILSDVIQRGAMNPRRRVLALVGDFATISYEMHVCGATTAVFSPIYLWVIFGNGFRFGVRYLFIAAAVANIMFLAMAATTGFWRDNVALSSGFFVGLVIIPAYVATLIRKLSAASEQAQAANKAKSLFLASVSHELRTPLHTITSAASLLDDTHLDGDQKDLTITLKNSARHLLSLIGDILDVSAMEANGLKTETCPTDITSMLLEIRSMTAIAASEKGLQLRIQVSPQLPASMSLDRRLVIQVLMNLVSNGLKFTSEGHITLTALPANDLSGVRFEVADTGIGIAQEALSLIFDSFVQADSTIIDRFGGTGLGLSIAKRLIGAMGGEIGVDSRLGRGSLFWFTLPGTATPSDADQETIPEDERATMVLVGDGDEGHVCSNLAGIGLATATMEKVEDAIAMVKSARKEGKAAYLIATAGKIERCDEAHRLLPVLRDLGTMLLVPPEQDVGIDRGETSLPMCISSGSSPAALRAAFRVVSNLNRAPLPNDWDRKPASTRKLKILVADDNQINRRLMEKILTRSGHQAVLVANGEEALDALESGSFDLVLMDVNMPVLDGIDAAKAYRFMEPYGERTPIVALTADATPSMAERCRNAGIDLVITKPVEREKLHDVIVEFAGDSRPTSVARETSLLGNQANVDIILPVLDTLVQKGLDDLGGPSFVRQLNENYVNDAADILRHLRAAWDRRDLKAYQYHAHAIRSSGLNVGAVAIGKFAHDAEEIQVDTLGDEGARLVARLDIEIKRLHKEIMAGEPATAAVQPTSSR